MRSSRAASARAPASSPSRLQQDRALRQHDRRFGRRLAAGSPAPRATPRWRPARSPAAARISPSRLRASAIEMRVSGLARGRGAARPRRLLRQRARLAAATRRQRQPRPAQRAGAAQLVVPLDHALVLGDQPRGEVAAACAPRWRRHRAGHRSAAARQGRAGSTPRTASHWLLPGSVAISASAIRVAVFRCAIPASSWSRAGQQPAKRAVRDEHAWCGRRHRSPPRSALRPAPARARAGAIASSICPVPSSASASQA